MIVCKEFPNKTFDSKEELFKSLKDHKNELVAQKKMTTKFCDSIVHYSLVSGDDGAMKTEIEDVQDISKLKLKVVINTTNVLDSHSDVHMKGIWKKTLKENKTAYLLQEHKMQFDRIIGELSPSIESVKFKDLGYNLQGDTEALIFEGEISKNRNEMMFNQYAKGYVKEHSVGMRYIKMFLCIDSESKYDVEEKENFDKYIDEVSNRKQAEDQGYFWAVTEAKLIEGSAVVKGSNSITPTITVESVKNISEPTVVTPKIEPSNDTQLIEHISSMKFI